jgi:hypothetical protein
LIWVKTHSPQFVQVADGWTGKVSMSFERAMRWSLVAVAVTGLTSGIAASFIGRANLADLFWTLATAPVLAGLPSRFYAISLPVD